MDHKRKEDIVEGWWRGGSKKNRLTGRQAGWQAGVEAERALTAIDPTLLKGQGHSSKVAAIHQCCQCHRTLTQL